MKAIFLILNRLLQYFLRSKVVFCLFILGGAVNALVFAYLYGNLLPVMTNRANQDSYYRLYTVDLKKFSGLGEALEKIANSELIESVTPGYEDYSGGQTVCAIYSGTPALVRVQGSLTLTEPGQVMAPRSDETPIGETTSVRGTTFTVVGRHTDEGYYLSYADYCKLELDTNRVYVVAAQRQNLSDDPVAALIEETFPGQYYRTAILFELTDRRLSIQQTVLICLCYGVCAISFASLLRYLVESTMDENIASLIVGAPKSAIAVFVFWEGLLLAFISSVLGLLFHKVLTPVLFSKINLSVHIHYEMGDYLAIMLCILVISVLILVPFALKYHKLTPVEARRQAK